MPMDLSAEEVRALLKLEPNHLMAEPGRVLHAHQVAECRIAVGAGELVDALIRIADQGDLATGAD